MDDTDYKRILEIFKKYDVRYFFYNGGNDSMDTCNKISKYMQKVGYECRIMGVPKTIDNDLNGTDHCPGFASAAKYIATSCAEVWQDAHVYDTGMVTIIEIMGRHAGWLAGAAALATIGRLWPRPRLSARDGFRHGPVHRRCEGRLRQDRQVHGRRVRGHPLRRRHLRLRGQDLRHRRLRPRPAGRSGRIMLAETRQAEDWASQGPRHRAVPAPALRSAHCASKTDIDEAYLAGQAAVEAAVSGVTDKMVAFKCSPGRRLSLCKTALEPLDVVANFEKKVPREWINEAGNGVNQAFIDYALPLIQGDANAAAGVRPAPLCQAEKDPRRVKNNSPAESIPRGCFLLKFEIRPSGRRCGP